MLERSGVLGRLTAELRAELLRVIADPSAAAAPRPPPDVLFVDDLIRDYLHATHHRATLSVFNAETGEPAGRPGSTHTLLPRRFLADEVGVPAGGDEDGVPLLITLVAAARDDARRARDVADPSGTGSVVAAAQASMRLRG